MLYRGKFRKFLIGLTAFLGISGGLAHYNRDSVAEFLANKAPIVSKSIKAGAEEQFLREALADIDVKVREGLEQKGFFKKNLAKIATSEKDRVNVVTQTIIEIIGQEFKDNIYFDFEKGDVSYLRMHVLWKKTHLMASYNVKLNTEMTLISEGPGIKDFSDYIASKVEARLGEYITEEATHLGAIILLLSAIIAAAAIFALRRRKVLGKKIYQAPPPNNHDEF